VISIVEKLLSSRAAGKRRPGESGVNYVHAIAQMILTGKSAKWFLAPGIGGVVGGALWAGWERTKMVRGWPAADMAPPYWDDPIAPRIVFYLGLVLIGAWLLVRRRK
jgi:hypothetical protein